MAETTSKRLRGEFESQLEVEQPKRHKSYDDILSILDEEEDESPQDLSSLITSLQQELSSPPSAAASGGESSSSSGEEDDKESVIRHLLEASDDELGIPNKEIGGFGVDEVFVGESGSDGPDGFSLCDGLWEFEDANANYYALLQAELFM